MFKDLVKYIAGNRKEKPAEEKAPEVKLVEYISVPIFNFSVCFTVGYKYDELEDALKKDGFGPDWFLALRDDKELLTTPGCYDFAMKRTLETEELGVTNHTYIILLNPFGFTDYEYCKLAHEVTHICQFILPDCFDITKELESFAYVHTYLMSECLKRMRNAQNKN